MKKLLLIKFLLYISFEVHAQQGFQQSQDIVVRKNGVELVNPWAGGANVPQADYTSTGRVGFGYGLADGGRVYLYNRLK